MKNSFNWKLGVWRWGTRPRVCVSRQSLHSPFVQPKQRQILCYFLFPNIGLKTQDLIYWFGSTYLISFFVNLVLRLYWCDPGKWDYYTLFGYGAKSSFPLHLHLFASQTPQCFLIFECLLEKIKIFNLQPLVTDQWSGSKFPSFSLI